MNPIGKIIEDLTAKYPQIQTEASAEPMLKIRNAAETTPLPKLDYLIEDLLPTPGVSVLSARPKVGKSTLARYISMLVATGQAFYDRSTRQGKVLYVGLEDHPGELDKQFKVVCPKDSLQHINFLIESPASHEKLIQGLSVELARVPYNLVVIDTLVQSTQIADWNDYGKTSAAVGRFRKIANQFNCHLMLIHHNGKNRELSGELAVLGSTGISASVDTMLLMTRRAERDTTIVSSERLRYGRKLDEIELILDPETGQISIGMAGSTLHMDDCETKILGLLNDSSRPMTQDEIRDAIAIRSGVLSQTLRSLTAKGRVLVQGDGTRGSPKTYLHPEL
ncbi:MAG: AAA family ATPase [Bdellovibrionales bacterium]|nr:AAA family ATPase [Bdellovibrionales bacterium]